MILFLFTLQFIIPARSQDLNKSSYLKVYENPRQGTMYQDQRIFDPTGHSYGGRSRMTQYIIHPGTEDIEYNNDGTLFQMTEKIDNRTVKITRHSYSGYQDRHGQKRILHLQALTFLSITSFVAADLVSSLACMK